MPPETGSHGLARTVQWTLRGGLLVSGLLLGLGLVRILIAGEPAPPALHTHLQAILAGVKAGDGAATIELGLLALIVTPVLRVAALLLGWLHARVPLLAGAALVVLALLLFSMWLGLG